MRFRTLDHRGGPCPARRPCAGVTAPSCAAIAEATAASASAPLTIARCARGAGPIGSRRRSPQAMSHLSGGHDRHASGASSGQGAAGDRLRSASSSGAMVGWSGRRAGGPGATPTARRPGGARSAGSPPLSMTRSALARRSSREAWRADAGPGVGLGHAPVARRGARRRRRAARRPRSRRCSPRRPVSTSSGTSRTTTRSVSRSASIRRLRLGADGRVDDPVQVLEGVRVVEHDLGEGLARSSVPSAARMPGPKRSTMAARTGWPGSCSSRVMASASMITAPRSASSLDTVDLPAPMPPVSPTRITGAAR